MRSFILLALSGLLLASCGGDKSLEDHQKEKANVEANRLASVAGTYRGSIKSQQSGESIGAMELELHVVRLPNDSGDTTTNKARLEGRVTVYSSAEQSSAVIELAEFASNDEGSAGTFSGRLSVPLRNSTVQLTINGNINGGSFTGTLSPSSRPGSPASFALTRDGALDFGGQDSVEPNPVRMQLYSGSFQDPNCIPRRRGTPCRGPETVKVRLRLDRNPQSADEAFLNHFLETQFVGLQLSFDEVTFALPGAELNEKAGTIRFQGIVQGSISTQASLRCRKRDAGWSCNYSSGSFGISYQFDLRPGEQ